MADTPAKTGSVASPDTFNKTQAATYAHLFPEQLLDRCSPDALENNSGPVAYLHALYQQAMKLEASSQSTQRRTLSQRRPDIHELLLSRDAVERPIPALGVVINALTRQVQEVVGKDQNLAEHISEAGVRAALPFHRPLRTIQEVLRRKNLPLFDALQRSEYGWPNLRQGSLRSDELREAMRASTGFSPALQQILLDKESNDDVYLIKHFGVTDSTPLQTLLQVDVICQKTGLNPEELPTLLATSGIKSKTSAGETLVRCSLAYPSGNTPMATSYHYGAAFINNGKAPALSLEERSKDGTTTRMIKGANAGHFVRINKLVHLRHSLGLSFAETDLLLMSALRAEGQTKDFVITPNTLRALGVFRYFKEVYKVTAEQFSALIYQISPYALDGEIPFLDRVLDGPGTGDLAGVAAGLTIDDRSFDLDAVSLTAGRGKADPLISQLSKALGVDERTVRLLVAQVAQSRGSKKPVLSLDLLSSLHRLSRLPRLLGLSRAQGACLMALVTVDKATAQSTLAGKGVIGDVANTPDILDVLVALANTEQWLRRQKLPASSVLAVLTPAVQTPELLAAMEAERHQVLAAHLSDLRGDCVSEQSIENLLRGNETLKPKQGTWLALVGTYVDEQGLIKVDLPDEERLSDALQTLFKDQLTGDAPAMTEMADRLASLLTNALVAQEDLVKNIIVQTLGRGMDDKNLLSEYALPLLRWIGKKPIDVLKNLMRPDAKAKILTQQQPDAFTLWSNLARHAVAIHLTGLTPAGLQALVTSPQWFNFNDTVAVQSKTASPPATLTLDLLYRLTRYREWVAICRDNGFEENDALLYLQTARSGNDSGAISGATRQLAALLGWEASEVLLAVPYVTMLKPVTTPAAKAAAGGEVATWDTFRSTLNAAEAKMFDFSDSMRIILHDLHCKPYKDAAFNRITVRGDVQLKLVKFLKEHPGPLNVTQAQFDAANAPEEWAKSLESAGKDALIPQPLKLQIYDGKTIVSHYEETEVPCVPDTLGDIDLVMRLKALCKQTGLSCQSLLNLTSLDDTSDFALFSSVADELLGACDEETRDQIEREGQEQWRDALLEYLIQAWSAEGGITQNTVTTPDDVCDHLLTDIGVSWKAKSTTQVSQAVASLQHYLYRLFARLEPGYDDGGPDDEDKQAWQRYYSDYGIWKQWRTQINHPENLIYYANRPEKSEAFQELELELNQGKLDTAQLHDAVCGYLAKFETLSNLQVVSGYLDGRNPKLDTYYLIGKNNTSPPQYYWRSVDMGLRDDKERLSPLAWNEWANIDIPVSGNVSQSTYTDPKNSAVTHRADAIRMVIIAGRPYVIWVERGVNGLPSSDEKNQTPTKFKKLSVQYSFLQTDGFWSPANELIVLNGCKDGKRLKDEGNNFLKDDTYVPGLIALVNVDGEREQDPWLTVVMYDCAKKVKGKENEDYFIEMRDLLLLERQTLDNKTPAPKTENEKSEESPNEKLITSLWASHRDIRRVQHPFNGHATRINGKHSSWQHALKDATKSLSMPLMVQSRGKTNVLTLSIGENGTDTFSGSVIVKVITPSSKDSKEEWTIAEKTFRAGQTKKFFESTYTAEQDGQYTIKVEILDDKRKLQHSGSYQFDLTSSLVDELWSVSIVKNESQAQFLDLNGASEEPPLSISHKVRLNTLFGKQLVARATQSVEGALGWGTQTLIEPTIDTNIVEPPVDFHGANGLYFRELFLHLPALIATRLTEQQQFDDAENWYLQYLFDPYRAHEGAAGQAPYWNTRPLAEVGKLTSALIKSTDPTERAFVLSRYYQQAVFLGLLENWQRQGDHLYRQLTHSSLNQAWRCYQQALRLIGPLPEGASVSSWTPTQLSGLTDAAFSKPFNPRVTEARRTLQQRLFNLRHGLTLDGKLLPNLDWRHEAADPFGAAKGGLSIIANSYNSDRATIPAYRLRQLMPIARSAARQLLDLGRHYMKLMENEANTALATLLMSQKIKISDFTLRLKKEAISAANARRQTLETSRKSAVYRHQHFENLLQTSLTEKEAEAAKLGWSAVAMSAIARSFTFAEAGADLAPNVFGFAIGGSRWGAPLRAVKESMEWGATTMWSIADQFLVQAAYERRDQEWELEKQLAALDIEVIDKEIAEQDIEINATGISLEESRQERLNLEEAYMALTTGFSIVPTYNWLVARQELLYGKAYDAVLSLCLSVEAAWRYEIGDYTREAFINTSAWSDSYKGMLAGESLLIDLQQMENAYLLENERRLTMTKTFSLRTIIGASAAAASKNPLDAWNSAMKDLIAGKPLLFAFTAADFDSSYPGQYLRQLKYVTVSFALSNGFEAREISALLTQTGNTTLIAPDKAGVDYLYAQSKTAPASIKRNLRAQQQIALSSTLKEDGLGYGPGERVFELMFHDERYLPFEGTGAISQWELTIPGAECRKRLASRDEDASIIEDIDVTLVYTAVGDNALIALVQCATADAPSSDSKTGSGNASSGETSTNKPSTTPASQTSAGDDKQQSAGVTDVIGGVVGAFIPRF